MQGLFRVLLYLYDCYVRLGVEGDDEKKKKENSQRRPSSTTNRIFWTPSSSTEQEKAKRENLCCSNVLSTAAKGFCVDHFLFNGSLSPSPTSRTLSCYQSINARKTYRTRKERKFVVEPFVRPSVHLSIRCCLFSAALLLCMRTYVRVYILSPHLLSVSRSLSML